MSLYDRVADLPFYVTTIERERNARETSSGFERVTTTFVFRGPGGNTAGRGEDVTYDAVDHDALDAAFDELTGRWTFAEFAARLDDADLFPSKPPEREDSRHYRRWGLESAALDLALKQSVTSLSEVFGVDPAPVSFVASARLPGGDTDRVHRLCERRPELGFKLDPEGDWPAETFADLRETSAVRILDLKGYYEGTEVDQAPDLDLYERVFDVPGTIVEDPALTSETRPLVEANADRIAFDAPVTGVESADALPVEPAWLNVKPSRFGSVESLFDTIEWAADNGVGCYGGGQFELDVGRTHVQLLASLLYPNAPNDVAPRVYNDPDVPADPPASPLDAPANARGLEWG
ncbi:hypothetical protein J2754_001644 [Halarchaeum solikamskense]|uniref:hypothetical protein n=1 Tax=Halarchaeum nitratireducens TaxID=489913 RepID=UPI001B3AEBA1|nr:hypothetical protein [Halarchaeum solikamskense]MBP2251319.1 hypothetical protein [Halarchaeum solikamskense]